MTTIVVAGRTAPNRAVRFGGEHHDLDDRGRRSVAEIELPAIGRVRIGPERSVVQTAAILGVTAPPDPSLASVDVGRWRGLTPDAVPPHELAEWFADPAACPHGGESVAAFVDRVLASADGFDGLVIVASPVAQALLAGAADVFFAVDVRPASIVTTTTPRRDPRSAPGVAASRG